MRPTRRGFAFGAVLATMSASAPALAQDAVAQFYKGKQITMVIGTSVGGGYDTYARLLARYMGKYIPGGPTIVPTNMPGAGSNVAAFYVYGVAPRDGTAIGAIFPGVILEPLIGNTKQKHDPAKFNYIGSANSDVYVCLGRADAPVKTFKDALTKEMVLGGSATGGSTRDFPILLNNVLGTKFRMVSGYPGTREIALAVERGEVQGQCGTAWSSIAATHPAWFKDGTVKVLAQENLKGYPELDRMGVPLTADFAATPEQRRILELVYSQTVFGRPFVVGPEVPKERVDALRQAFMQALADPELLAEAQKINLDLGPVSGEELQALITKIYASPPELIEKVKQALVPKG